MLKKLIRIGDVDVQQGLCSISFSARISMEGSTMVNTPVDLTHGKLYNLLETATDVKEIKDSSSSRFVTFKQGVVEFEVYVKNNR